VGQPGCGRRLPQPGQLTIGEELLGYHNNNKLADSCEPGQLLMVLPICSIVCRRRTSGSQCRR